jgi:hypothetical protein
MSSAKCPRTTLGRLTSADPWPAARSILFAEIGTRDRPRTSEGGINCPAVPVPPPCLGSIHSERTVFFAPSRSG